MTTFRKTGAHLKGRRPPNRIVDVEATPCPSASTDEQDVMHTLTHTSNNVVVCQFCKMDWATLDEMIREETRKEQAAREAEREAEE